MAGRMSLECYIIFSIIAGHPAICRKSARLLIPKYRPRQRVASLFLKMGFRIQGRLRSDMITEIISSLYDELFMANISPESKIKVGVSSCLLGEKVRWNGDHKQDLFVKNLLGQFFEWVPTCPEVEIGMGIPRETVQLTGDPGAPRMVGNTTGTDWTSRMNRYSKKRSTALAKLESVRLHF